MKRVSIILAMFFVAMITLPACESEVEEIVPDQPNTEKTRDAENLQNGHDWD